MKKYLSFILLFAFTLILITPVQLLADDMGGGGQFTIYTLTKESLDNSGIKAYVIDKKTAFSVGGDMTLIEGSMPQYLKYPDFLSDDKDYVPLPSGDVYKRQT